MADLPVGRDRVDLVPASGAQAYAPTIGAADHRWWQIRPRPVRRIEQGAALPADHPGGMTILAEPDMEGQRPVDADGGPDTSAEGVGPQVGSLGDQGATAVWERCAWSLVWLGVVLGGLALWGSWSSWPPGAYLAPLIVALGIVGTAAAWLVPSPRNPVLQVSALLASLAATLGHEGIGIHVRHYYSTDSGAFNQVAAHLLVHGSNPYTSSMASASNLLQTPVDYWTYTATGGHITAVSYPAGSFLMEVPALLLGFHHQITDWMDLLAWLVTGALIFVLLPASLRWIGPLLVAVPLYADVFGSGGTDAVFLPFLVLAVWRWDRFCAGRGAGLARWVGPIALGLACSIKQTPWFCVPFLAIGIYLECRSAGRRPLRIVAGYLVIVAGVFTAVNLPFIIWQPRAWARGTVLPFDRPLVADGQGLVTLALHGAVRGVALPLLTVVSVLVFVSLLAALVVWYPAMKRIWMLLLPLTFFVGARSLLTYLLDLFPAAIVAAVTVAAVARPAHARSDRLRMPWALAALGAGRRRRGRGRGGLQLGPASPGRHVVLLDRAGHPPRLGDRRRPQHHRPDRRPPLHGDHRKLPSHRVLAHP